MDDALIAAHGEVPQLMPYLHLPVQSGSDRILEAMNRGHGRDLFLRLVERLRAARPDIALSADFIVGFPGESDADFDDTMRLIDEVGFASAFSFKYTRRPGTPASAMPDQVPESVKEERLAALQALLGEQARAFNASKVGATVPVLFAEPGRKPGQLDRQDAVAAVGLCRGQPAADRPYRRRAPDRGLRQQPGRRDRRDAWEVAA